MQIVIQSLLICNLYLIIDASTCLDDQFKEWIGNQKKCVFGNRNCDSGGCDCRKGFNGDDCSNIVCQNKGLPDYDYSRPSALCQCPHSNIIGQFCEKLNCANNGIDTKNGRCKCPSSFRGRFCEEYYSPWGAVIGAVVGSLILIVVLWFLCQWYWGRKQSLDEVGLETGIPEVDYGGFRFRHNRYTERRHLPPSATSTVNEPNSALLTTIVLPPVNNEQSPPPAYEDIRFQFNQDETNSNKDSIQHLPPPPSYENIQSDSSNIQACANVVSP